MKAKSKAHIKTTLRSFILHTIFLPLLIHEQIEFCKRVRNRHNKLIQLTID